MIYLIAAVAIAYQLLTLVAVLWRRLRVPVREPFTPRVSILRPVKGVSPCFYEANRSNALQRYPDFELLFGFSNAADPAKAPVARLAAEFDHIRLLDATTRTANGKVGTLMDLAGIAQGEVLVVSDADIAVPEGYLARVVAPLRDPAIGLVTCAYRARSDTWAGRFEALGVATDFTPSTMLAPFVGVDEFALGSTLAFRRRDLDRIGGFAAVADYLADDYQIGHRIHALGLKCLLSEVIVETHLPGSSWRAMWRHQVRWSRTIRVSRYGGYVGLPVTFATVWALVAALTGHGVVALAILGSRMTMALGAGWWGLGSRDVAVLFWMIPLRDLFGAAVWAAGLVGNTVEWGGRRLRLDCEGRIRE